jgi:hypothetical protein
VLSQGILPQYIILTHKTAIPDHENIGIDTLACAALQILTKIGFSVMVALFT